MSKIENSFSISNTLLVALVGALIGQLSILLVAWIKTKIELNKKKKLIISDLINQKIILDRLELKLLDLKSKIENKNDSLYNGDIFHDLQNAIYESVSKVDLYKIFHDKIGILVDVYGSILFLKDQNPSKIYGRYINSLNKHITEKENDPNHKLYCSTHLGFIRIAIEQIDSNLKTIKDVKDSIDNIYNHFK